MAVKKHCSIADLGCEVEFRAAIASKISLIINALDDDDADVRSGIVELIGELANQSEWQSESMWHG